LELYNFVFDDVKIGLFEPEKFKCWCYY